MASKKIDSHAIKVALPIEELLLHYGVPTKNDAGRLVASCIFHDDGHVASFKIDTKKMVFKCHAGSCGKGGDIFTIIKLKEGLDFIDACKWIAQTFRIEIPELAAGASKGSARTKVAEYIYKDEAGAVVQVVERWEPGKNGRSKDFIQRIPMDVAIATFGCDVCDAPKGEACGHEKRAAKMNPHQVLYALGSMRERAHETIYIVEGEKVAEALISIGVLATTWVGGAAQKKRWTKEFAAPLAGRKVVVLPDPDEGGRAIADHICFVLRDVASEVRLLDLPQEGPAAKAKAGKADAVEWIADGGTKQALLQLAARAPLAGSDEAWSTTFLKTESGVLRPTVGNALIILGGHAAFRGVFFFDERSLTVHVERPLPWDRNDGRTKYPRQLVDDDAVFGAAWCERNYRTPISSETFGKAIWAMARKNMRNPLGDWLRELHWDNKPRVDSWLVRLAGAKDGQFVRAVSAAWLISAVARALDPGCKVDHVLVLESPQGRSKSSLLRALAGASYFADHLPDLDSKDAALILGQAWIIEFSELEGLTKSEVTKVKAFVTRQQDVFRPPYDRSTIRVPRGCVFSASTNEDTYLRDPTGARRWWPVTVQRIDVNAALAERDQLWAEAVHRYREGEKWWFTDEELIALAFQETSAREQSDPWESRLDELLDGRTLAVTIVECFRLLDVKDVTKMTSTEAKRIGQILRKLGWVRTKRRVPGSAKRTEWCFTSPDADDVNGGGGGGSPPDTGDSGPHEYGTGEPPVYLGDDGTTPEVPPSTAGNTQGTDEEHALSTGVPSVPRVPPGSSRARAPSEEPRAGASPVGVVSTSSPLFKTTGNTGNRGNNSDSSTTNAVPSDVPSEFVPADLGGTDEIIDDAWGDR